ncbi:MAG: protein kinase [Deltaproteobacteria bacterium]|nr:protein kinase [Deltaproteobacteria bacterium]
MQDLQAQSGPRDKYEILRVVNRGGMGEIALARVRGTKGFEKLVVLKRLRADAEREDHRQMFDVEAELMSRIEHPNIVQVFDQPIVGGVQYLAMAYLRGRNLDQLIRRVKKTSERLMPQFCLTIVAEVMRGLAFVHRLKDEDGTALGVVHQDITPSNIMLSFFGEVKITDFGIAYVTSRDGGRRKGVLKGKPRYVSPEVLAGRRVNNRADIYGVAVVLYEMLAGRALFARASVDETLAAVARNELPDLAREFPHLGPGAISLMYRALAKDPQDRFRTAEEMFAETTAELARIGGPLSPSHLGYFLRKVFHDAPDLPEADPTIDAAIEKETKAFKKVEFRAPDLEQTLSELDRLLGAGEGSSSSHELFSLPPELATELSELDDMDPFDAKTPIPELALSGPNGEELLLNAILKTSGDDGLIGPVGLGGLPVLPGLGLPDLGLPPLDGLGGRPTPSPPPLLRRSTSTPGGFESPDGARAPTFGGRVERPPSSFGAQLEPLAADDSLAKSVMARSRRAKLSAKPSRAESRREDPHESSPDVELITSGEHVLAERPDPPEVRSADVPIEAPVEQELVAQLAAAREEGRLAALARDALLQQRDALLTERAELVAERDGLRSERDAAIASKDATLSESTAMADSLSRAGAERESIIADRAAAERRASTFGFVVGVAVGALAMALAWLLA